MKAIWNGQVIAETEESVKLEGNIYFPKGAVENAYLKESEHESTCPWKGHASYYSLEVDGKENPDAAWYYPSPSDAAAEIKDHIAFWKGVEVVE